ncbi:MAG: hypothetical protein WD116_02385 [Chloroflexota bacterium]
MDNSKLNSNDKMALYASFVVVVTGIISITNDWGSLVALAMVGGIGMAVVLLAPSMMPTMRLPGSRGSLLLITGGVAAVAWGISALTWLDWIFRHLATFDTLQFLVGLVAALVCGWTGWQAFKAEGGKFNVGTAGAGSAGASPPPAAPPAPPTDASAPTMGDGSSGEDRQP